MAELWLTSFKWRPQVHLSKCLVVSTPMSVLPVIETSITKTPEKGHPTGNNEEEEEESISSPLNLQHDTTHFRQLLCPDPFCEVCNRTTAEVSRLLSQAYLKETACALSPSASPAPMKKSSSLTTALSAIPSEQPIRAPTPTFSVPSPNQDIPLKDFSSSSPLEESEPSKPISQTEIKFPVDPSPSEQLALISPPLAHPTQGGELVLQQVCPLSTVDSPDRLSTCDSTMRDPNSSSLEVSGFSCSEPIVKNTLSSDLVEHKARQNCLDLHSSEASAGDSTPTYYVEPCNLSFVGLDVLKFLESQIKKREGLLMWKERENKIASFSKHDTLLSSVGKVLGSVAEEQDLAVSLPFGMAKGKQEELHKYVQAPGPNPYEDHSRQKSSAKHFWGLPSLHSESLSPAVVALGDCTLKLVFFNIISNVATAHESPIFPNPKPLPLSDIQSQVLPETLCQDLPMSQAQAQAQFQSPLPVLPPSLLPQVRACGVCFHGPQSETQILTTSEIHHMEHNILRKKQENVWGLPSVVRGSQEDFCSPAPQLSLARQYSQANVTVSILPGDFPLTSELRQKLEHHLRKRLIQHRWALPHRIQESLSWISPRTDIPQGSRADIPQSSESKSSQGLSWFSSLKFQSSTHPNFESIEPESVDEKNSEIPLLEEEVGKEQGYSPEIGPTDHLSSDSEGDSHSSSGSDSESSPESYTESMSRNTVNTSLSHKQLKDALEKHWDKKFAEISKGQIPGTATGSLMFNNMQFPSREKSPSQMKQTALEPLMGVESSLSIPPNISFHDSSKQTILEDRIKFFYMKMMHGLLQNIRETVEIVNEKENPYQACSNLKLPSPSSSISGEDSQLSFSQPLSKNFDSEEKIRSTNSTYVGTLGPRGPDLPDLKYQLFDELKLKMESRKKGKAQGLQDDQPLESDNLKNRSLFTFDSGDSSGDVATSHVLHALQDKSKISREQAQKPCTTSDLHKSRGKNLPQVKKGMSPATPKSRDFGGGDTGLAPSQPRKQTQHPQEKAKERPGTKSSHPLSQKVRPPHENRFRTHMKQFFQWLSTGKNSKGQSSLGKGSSPSVQARSLGKGRAAIPANTEHQKVPRDTGKVPGVKGVQRHGVDTMCSPGPFLSSVKSGKTQQKAEKQTQPDHIQGQNLNKKASCSSVSCVKSRMQEAACPGQSNLEKNRKGTGWHGEPTNVLFANHRHLTAMAHREPVLHGRPTCKRQMHQVPPAAPSIPNGSVLENVSLLKEKIFIILRDKSSPPSTDEAMAQLDTLLETRGSGEEDQRNLRYASEPQSASIVDHRNVPRSSFRHGGRTSRIFLTVLSCHFSPPNLSVPSNLGFCSS
ncbi:spermatogenesis-associated protein 31D3-like [Thomomys bottae]